MMHLTNFVIPVSALNNMEEKKGGGDRVGKTERWGQTERETECKTFLE